MRLPHPSWLTALVLPGWWGWTAGQRALGRRTGDLVSHIWANWNGSQGDPTTSTLFCWPEGVDLLPIYGGWLHTLVGSTLVRTGFTPVSAYTAVLCSWLVVAGLAGIAVARVCGVRPWLAVVGGLLLQLDGFVLYHAMDGRPEHAGLGFTALALTAAVWAWQRGGRLPPIVTGLLGALVFVVSWEHALWLALACAWLLPWMLTTPTGKAGLRRWLAAAGVCLLAAGPWIALFFVRALSTRAVDEGAHTLYFSIDQSLALGRWLLGPGRHPGRGLVLLAVALPWLVPRSHRRLAVGVVLGLVASVVLALGPSPGLWRGGDLWTTADGGFRLWGPFALMQQLPILGWFHSPARLAMGVSVAVAAGGALLVERAWAWKRPVAGLLALGLPAYAAGEAWMGGDWPVPAFDLPPYQRVVELADHPAEGAVLSLPVAREGHQHEQRVVFQLLHKRPIAGHIYLPYLAPDQTPRFVDQSGWLRWLSEGGPPADFAAADRGLLQRGGFAFVTVFWREVEPERQGAMRASLSAALGDPVAEQPGLWSAYAVGE